MQVKMTSDQWDAYRDFEVEIPSMLDEIQVLFSQSKAYQKCVLSFDDDGLLAFGALYIDLLEKKEHLQISEARLDRLFLAYFGQAFIHHFGGYWTLNDIKEDSSFNCPVIVGWGKEKDDNIRKSPVETMEMMKKNKRRDWILYSINYTKEMTKKIDDFFNDWK